MRDANWWLMSLAFLLGLLLTLALTIRKVTREVPVTRTVAATIPKPDLGKVAGAVTATGAAAAAGAAAKLHVAADKVEKKVVEVEKKVVRVDEKVEHVLEKEPYGAGSIRVSARTVAPVGYTIKGDKDTGRYFTLDSPEYEAIEAEVWFADEASAAKAGFLRWDGTDRKVGLLGTAAETVVTEQHVVAETVITELHSTADSALVIVDDGVAEARTVIVDDGIADTTIRIIGAED
jgi:hypothetical protein